MHDALIVDQGPPPVPRTSADRLFLAALREPGEKTGTFRHWLMWSAVAAFGTMPRALRALFVAHVLAVWLLVVAAIAWGSGPALWPTSLAGRIAVVPAVLIGTLLVLLLLGIFWQAGVDHTGGWLSPSATIAVAFAVTFWLEWSRPLELSPTLLLLIASALTVLGFAWGVAVDPTLRWWLWPTTLLGLPIALLPTLFILIAVGFVLFLDLGAAVGASVFAGREFHWPSPKPYRLPL